ncbi:MAG: SDR family oxidoreductase [Candidatus Dadabacteria bacterium]|nr:SDR family oxidoreductase [Candidatus Dadabacteria bacterium]
MKDRVAIVAASSKGLGKATALGLAKEGVKLTICSRDKDTLQKTADEISSQTKANVLALQCDVSKTDQIKNVVKETINKYSKVDILINNAGGPPVGAFLDFTLEDWQKAIELNLFSAITFSNEVIPCMKKNKWGRIVNITSYAVKQPVDGLMLSNTVRAGIVGMAKTMSNEFGPYNILVNNICPGRIFTDRITFLANERAKKEGKSFDQVITEMGSDVPVGRIGRPEELADLAVFLASERASYITGTTIQVDGGLIKGLL